MVDGHLFDTLAKLAVELRRLRTDLEKPFGGIQVCDHPTAVSVVLTGILHTGILARRNG